MAEPPSLDGAVQVRLIATVPLAVAMRPVGVAGHGEGGDVEAAPVPTELMAETR